MPTLSRCEETPMDTKRRRQFQLEDANGKKLATGVLYDEGNVQVLWRADIGWTAEQYSSTTPLLNLMPGIAVLRLSDAEN